MRILYSFPYLLTVILYFVAGAIGFVVYQLQFSEALPPPFHSSFQIHLFPRAQRFSPSAFAEVYRTPIIAFAQLLILPS